MKNNIEEIARRLAEKNGELADIFDRIAIRILEKIHEKEMDIEEVKYPSNSSNKIYPPFNDPFYDPNYQPFDCNTIPSRHKGICHPICLAYAFDKWTRKNGFTGIAKEVIAVWLKCLNINQFTLIFSSAWDEIDFNELFKDQFDGYSNQGKTVCVILVTDEGFSIQYLR